MILEAIAVAAERKDLPEELLRGAFMEMTQGSATDAQTAALLMALRTKGETVEEIAWAAGVMRERCTPVPNRAAESHGCLVDTCGTGGDGTGSFNVSTVSAFLVAGSGVPVAKHGNRSVSSGCGSADLLEALGLDLGLGPEAIGRSIEQIGMGFLYAPALHGSMRHVAGARREMGIRTLFNVLGPLCNPAGADTQLLGVSDPELTQTMAAVLPSLGVESAFVVHGSGGYDEITVTGPTLAARVREGEVLVLELEPADFGLSEARPESVLGGDVDACKRIALNILEGRDAGPRRDMALMNASAALVAAGRAPDLRDGVDLALHSLESGGARGVLQGLVDFARSAGKERSDRDAVEEGIRCVPG